jgi:hypothetical protein
MALEGALVSIRLMPSVELIFDYELLMKFGDLLGLK